VSHSYLPDFNLQDLAQHLAKSIFTRPVAGFHRASPSTSLDKSK